MPFVLSFSDPHAFPFDGVGHDYRWLIGLSEVVGRLQCRNDLCVVMAIDLQHAPTEFFEDGLEIDSRPGVTPVAAVLFA